MKGLELAKYLLKRPNWEVEFYFFQYPDEIEGTHIRTFHIMDVAESAERKATVLIGVECG